MSHQFKQSFYKVAKHTKTYPNSSLNLLYTGAVINKKKNVNVNNYLWILKYGKPNENMKFINLSINLSI